MREAAPGNQNLIQDALDINRGIVSVFLTNLNGWDQQDTVHLPPSESLAFAISHGELSSRLDPDERHLVVTLLLQDLGGEVDPTPYPYQTEGVKGYNRVYNIPAQSQNGKQFHILEDYQYEGDEPVLHGVRVSAKPPIILPMTSESHWHNRTK